MRVKRPTQQEGEEIERMKTTMVLPRDLWKRAKVRAVDDGIDLSGVVIAALESYLKGKGGKR